LQLVPQDNEATAPGGSNLLTNPFTAYEINPAKAPGVNINVEGAEAFIEYLASEAFQARLASYPNATSPAFFADAHPKLISNSVSGNFDPGAKFTLSGTITSTLPGAQPVSGVAVKVQEAPFGHPSNYTTVASGTTNGNGGWTVPVTATREGYLRVEMPITGAAWPDLNVTPLISSGGLTQTFVPAGQIGVRPTPSPSKKGKVPLPKRTEKGRVVTLNGRHSRSAPGAADGGGIGAPVVALIVVVLLAGGVLFEWRRRRPGR
jgi:hypothetical protein